MDSSSIALLHTWFLPAWVFRTRGRQPEIAEQVQRAVASVDDRLPFAKFETLDQLRAETLKVERSTALLTAVLAGLALLLVAIGIYGLIASSVVERTREIGIRLALGSTVRNAIVTVSAPGVGLATAGLVSGCGLALLGGRILRGMLWGIQTTDPLTFAAVCATILGVAVLASLLPGWRVTRIDPAESLREE